MVSKLTGAQLHVLRLINRDKNENGLTKVSTVLFPAIRDITPKELVEWSLTTDSETGVETHFVKLTEKGEMLLAASEYFTVV